MRTLLIPIAVAAFLGACSRTQQPMVDAVKPAQQTVEAAKGLEQSLQKAQDERDQKAQQQ